MPTDPRDGLVARIYVIAFVDPTDKVLVQMRVETRDWMDRLLSRSVFNPLLVGGPELAAKNAIELGVDLLEDSLPLLEVARILN